MVRLVNEISVCKRPKLTVAETKHLGGYCRKKSSNELEHVIDVCVQVRSAGFQNDVNNIEASCAVAQSLKIGAEVWIGASLKLHRLGSLATQFNIGGRQSFNGEDHEMYHSQYYSCSAHIFEEITHYIPMFSNVVLRQDFGKSGILLYYGMIDSAFTTLSAPVRLVPF